MRTVAMDVALSPAAIAAGQQQYLGSFIAFEHPTFYHSRSLAEITPAVMRDTFAASLYTVMEKHAGEEGFDFSPRMLAHSLIEDGHITGLNSDVDVALDNLTKRLQELARSGARNGAEFKRKEALLHERIRSEAAETADKSFAQIMKAADGLTYAEKLQKIEALARDLRGQFVQTQRNMDSQNMSDIAAQMRAESDARVGHIKLTYPPQFGKVHERIFPQRKELVVISGGSGGGKSILVHLWAEWLAICGFRVLFVMTEDSIELALARATARHIPHTTWMEVIEQGDPQNKKEQYIKLTQEWLTRGGEIVYKERPGIGGVEAVNFIETECNDAQSQGKPYDFIMLDYFTDLDFEQDVMQKFYSNPVAAAAACAVKLRGIAQKRNAVMVCASQESGSDATDDVHTYGSRRLTQKAQQWLRFQRPKSDKDIDVVDSRTNTTYHWVRAGETMPLLYLTVQKANRFQTGFRVPLFMFGPGQQVFDKSYYRQMQENPDYQYRLPVYTIADDTFYADQAKAMRITEVAIGQVDPDMYDPAKKAKKTGRNIPG